MVDIIERKHFIDLVIQTELIVDQVTFDIMGLVFYR